MRIVYRVSRIFDLCAIFMVFKLKKQFMTGSPIKTFEDKFLPFPGRGEKRRLSIIRCTCAFDSKKWRFSEAHEFVSRYEVRIKKFFGKIEISYFLHSKFVENQAISARI